MKKIDIIGWYSRKNVGDDAFELVLSNWFRGFDVRFVTPTERTRDSADLVILGGGAVASEYYLNRIQGSAPLVALGVDIEWPKEAQLLLDASCSRIVFRSKEDVETYETLWGAANLAGELNAEYCPDLAFALAPTGKDVVSKYKLSPTRGTIGVFATDYVMPSRGRDLYFYGPRADQFCQGLARTLDRLAEISEVILLPSSTGIPGDDRRVNMHIASFMEHTPTIVTDYLSPHDMIDFIAGCTATMCMRYHAHIFSIIAGTPFVNIEYTKKSRTLLSEYQPLITRPIAAISRKNTGYFDFDNAYDATVVALLAGRKRSEFEISRGYAEKCAIQGEAVKEMVLSGWLR